MEFTYDAYGKLIALLREKGYSFSDYKNYKQHEKVVILRHDVDMDLKKALEMARFENSHGVHSTYYVLISSDFYNAFSKKNVEIINKISELGHDIGLHFDEEKYKGSNDIISELEKEVNLLEAFTGHTIASVSMHRPSQKTLEEGWIIRGGSVINSYSKEFFHDFKYVSDSRCNWREDICGIVNSEKYDRLHILTHPIWYNQKARSTKQVLSDFVKSARTMRYITLDQNFRDLQSVLTEREAEVIPRFMSEINNRCFDSDRLVFTPICEEDTEGIYEYGKDAETCRFLNWGPYESIEEADVFVKKKIASDDMQWMIKDKYTGNIVGGIRLYDVDINNKCASVSYIQSRRSCGNGYMTESLVAMLKFAEQHGFEIIYTYYIEENIKSERVMQRAGMEKDKGFIDEIIIKGQMHKENRYYKKLGEKA